MEKTQNQLTDIIARENGTDFNKSIKIAIADGEIDNNELKSLSRAYKENISGKIQITKENINQLKRSLNV
jgi:L-2-hydroxyglutarate oxidase LhgO